MLGEEDNGRVSGASRKMYLRSFSWTDRSPTKPNTNPRPLQNSKVRACLPPLQPLSITRRNVEEWPRAGSDDLGVWPNPQTPRVPITPSEKLNLEKPVREFEFKKDKLAFFDKECSRIADHVYLGSDAVAKNRDILRENGITHVLNCVGFVSHEYFKGDLVYKTLWLHDSPSEDITSILYDVFDYFEDVREQGGRVFVHCFQGVSRSTSLVIAYLIWREGRSFEDAFHYVKAARGVTNPNMGFTCQLLQCQKRVHAVPASPNSVLRMYRMAPHSPYDPLYLVPKMLSHPGEQGLDSRGAFIVHVPSAIYVWTGKNCTSAMSNSAKAAALQVVKYERAQGPIASITEGEEPSEFWDALTTGQLSIDSSDKLKLKGEETLSSGTNKIAGTIHARINERKVGEYDLDFDIFHKALMGGVITPFSVSNSGTETCLPARENMWCKLRQKFANGVMKEFITSSKLNSDFIQQTDKSDMIIDTCKEEEHSSSPAGSLTPSSPLTTPSGASDSLSSFQNSSSDRKRDTCKEVKHPVLVSEPVLSPASCGSPDSFSCYRSSSPNFSYKSPTLSPSTSDYSSPFTFSPSSSNWSDLSYLSSRQPSPSGLQCTDIFSVKNASSPSSSILQKETSFSPKEVFSTNQALGAANTTVLCKGTSPSIAERRGSNPPPRMMLPSVDESSHVPRDLIRSWSFSLPDLDDDVMMKDIDCNQYECEGNGEEIMLDVNMSSAGSQSQSKVEDQRDDNVEITAPVFYQWPTMDKVEMHYSKNLDPKCIYVLLAPDASSHANITCIVYVWVGREVSNETGQSQLIRCDNTYKDSHFCWEMVGHNFLNRMGMPVNATLQCVQIVKDGNEPEQFLNNLNHFSFQKTEYSSHN